MKRREIRAKFDEIVEFSGVEKFIDTPVKRYSTGMYVRLAFAVAAHLEPEVLLIDEVLAVGDHEFQQRCMGRIEDISESGRTVVFVSHDMQAIARLCDRAYWLDGGRVVAEGPSEEIVAQYLQSASGTAVAWQNPKLGQPRRPERGRPARGAPGRRPAAARPSAPSTSASPSGSSFASRSCERAPLFPKIKVGDDCAARSSSTPSTSTRAGRRPPSPGRTSARPGSPANLLNEGFMTVDAGLFSLARAEAPPLRQPARRSLVPRPRPGRGRLLEGVLHRAAARRRAADARVDDGARRRPRLRDGVADDRVGRRPRAATRSSGSRAP